MKQHRAFRLHPNFLDFLLLGLLALFLLLFLFPRLLSVGEKDFYLISFVVAENEDGQLHRIERGDRIWDETGEVFIGTVTRATDTKITVRCGTAEEKDGTLFLDELTLRENTSLLVRTAHFSGTLACHSIKTESR